MTTYTADTILEDQVAAELLTDIREAGEEFLEEIKFPPLAMLTPGFEPAGPRGEFERIMHCLREVAAENSGMSTKELRLALSREVGDIFDAYWSEQDRRKAREGMTDFILGRRIEVVKAFLRTFIALDYKYGL